MCVGWNEIFLPQYWSLKALLRRRFLFEGWAELLQRIDVEPFANGRELLRFDVTDDVNEHGLTFAVEHGDDQAFHDFPATGLEVNAHIFILLLHADDSFPSFGVQFVTDRFDALDHVGAILVIQTDHVDTNELEAAEQVRNLRFAFLHEASGHRNEVAVDLDFDELAARGWRSEFAEINASRHGFLRESTEADHRRNKGEFKVMGDCGIHRLFLRLFFAK